MNGTTRAKDFTLRDIFPWTSFHSFLVTALHNGPAVNYDALVVKIFHIFQEFAKAAYYPKLEFENRKNQNFSWLLRSEHVKTNIFGNRMTKLTI